MATVRMAGAAALDTVVVLAGTAGSLINSVGSSAKMLNAFVDNAHDEQTKRIIANRELFIDNLKVNTAIESAKCNQRLMDYLADHPDQAETVKATIAKLTEALA